MFIPLSLLSLCVPAGYIVKQMGLPLKLVAMVNSNDIVHRMVTTGDFSMAANVTQTLAPAIDIQVTVTQPVLITAHINENFRHVSLKITFDKIMYLYPLLSISLYQVTTGFTPDLYFVQNLLYNP